MPACTMKGPKKASAAPFKKGGTGTQIINGSGQVGHMGDDGEFHTEGASNRFSARKAGAGAGM